METLRHVRIRVDLDTNKATYATTESDLPAFMEWWNDHTEIHGQPFGFTHEDVDALRMSARTVLGRWEHDRLIALADRIAALLPPR